MYMDLTFFVLIKMEIKGNTILWVKNNKNWIVFPKTLINAYIKGIHHKDLLKTISNITGKWWLPQLKSIKNYKKIPISNLTELRTKLGNGQYATVYAYKKYAVKIVKHRKNVNGVTEAKILRLLDLHVTRNLYTPNIIQLYEYIHTNTFDYLILQKQDINLWKYLQTKKPLSIVKNIILQVVFTLCILQKLYPGFRHNDLKIDNILLDLNKREDITLCYGTKCWLLKGTTPLVKIADFDYCNIPKHILNPKVGTTFSFKFGCTKRNNKIYDVHLFFNSLYKNHKNINGLQKYIQNFIPIETLSSDNEHVLYSRLRKPEIWVGKIATPFEILKTYKTVSHSYPSWGLKK